MGASKTKSIITVAHNCHGKTKNLTAKTKYLTAKPKTSRQKQNTSRQNQNPHCKILHSKNQKPHGKSKYPWQNQSYFVFAVKLWFCREVFGFAATVVGHHVIMD